MTRITMNFDRRHLFVVFIDPLVWWIFPNWSLEFPSFGWEDKDEVLVTKHEAQAQGLGKLWCYEYGDQHVFGRYARKILTIRWLVFSVEIKIWVKTQWHIFPKGHH